VCLSKCRETPAKLPWGEKDWNCQGRRNTKLRPPLSGRTGDLEEGGGRNNCVRRRTSEGESYGGFSKEIDRGRVKGGKRRERKG